MLTRSLLLTLCLTSPAWADDAMPDADAWTNNAQADARPLSTPTATPWVFKESKAAVTPDPGFTHADFANRWPHVSLDEARRLHRTKGVVFVDGRSHAEWQHSHVPGALSLPVGEFDARYAKAKTKLKRAKVLVAYCHGENCRLADHLAQQLVGKGHHNVAVFTGGFPAWSNQGLPLTNEAGKPLPTPTFKPPTAP